MVSLARFKPSFTHEVTPFFLLRLPPPTTNSYTPSSLPPSSNLFRLTLVPMHFASRQDLHSRLLNVTKSCMGEQRESRTLVSLTALPTFLQGFFHKGYL